MKRLPQASASPSHKRPPLTPSAMAEKTPTLIMLNGASSAGKTTVVQALLPLLGPDTVSTGLDDIMERRQPFGPEASGRLGQLQRSLWITWFQLTDGRLRLFKRLHREVLAHLQAGRDVIVETALMDPRALRDAAECFAPWHALFVGVKPPLAISEQWEAQRGDRPPGHARHHYEQIHAHGYYDLLLDPSVMTPEACAQAILQRVEGLPVTAFGRLLRERSLPR